MRMDDLPDFDTMTALAVKIGQTKTSLMVLETRLDLLLADITKEVSTNQAYFVEGKIPTNVYIKDTYHKFGLDNAMRGNLLSMRDEIAQLTGELKTDEALFKVYQEMIDIWRTESANKRGAYI